MNRRCQSILTLDAGTIGTSAAQLFATANVERTEIAITNTGTVDGEYIYIWFASNVSDEIWEERLNRAESRSFYCEPDTEIWIVGAVAGITYTASEKGS